MSMTSKICGFSVAILHFNFTLWTVAMLVKCVVSVGRNLMQQSRGIQRKDKNFRNNLTLYSKAFIKDTRRHRNWRERI